MPKTRPGGSRPPAKCLLALEGPQPPSNRMTRTAWRKVRGAEGPELCPKPRATGGRWAGRRDELRGRSRPHMHTPPPHTQTRPRGLRDPASTQTATGSHRRSWRSRTSRERRRHSARPRCRPGTGEAAAPRGPYSTLPWVLKPCPPQVPAGGSSEETVAKAKQSRSEKKARKVGGLLPGPLPGEQACCVRGPLTPSG